MADPRGIATGDWLACESLSFERDFARSRHNFSRDEFEREGVLVEPTVPAPWNTVGLTATSAQERT